MPNTKEELYLAAILGEYSGELPMPNTKVECYLYKLATDGVPGGSGGGTVDLSDYAKKEDLVGQKTTDGGEIFNNYENNIATTNSHAEGSNTKAYGEKSHAEGFNTIAGTKTENDDGTITYGGQYAHAEGNGTTASDIASHAEGISTTASNIASHAEGYGTKAFGMYSHAEGFSTTASGSYSHAEGISTTASGAYSHTEGAGTAASGNKSHAEGEGTEASGETSHAEGYNTKASSNYQHVQGKFNIEDTNGKYAFIIGNGEDNSNRSNAFAIDWNGLIYLNNSDAGIDLSNLTTKEEVAQAIEYAHTHQNKTTLNKITAAKFESWETAVQQIGDIQTVLESIVEVSE